MAIAYVIKKLVGIALLVYIGVSFVPEARRKGRSTVAWFFFGLASNEHAHDRVGVNALQNTNLLSGKRADHAMHHSGNTVNTSPHERELGAVASDGDDQRELVEEMDNFIRLRSVDRESNAFG